MVKLVEEALTETMTEVHPDHKRSPGQSSPRLQTKQAVSQTKHVLMDTR